MATVLKNILNFTGLTIGVPSVQAHLLNINGIGVVPRNVYAQNAGYTITADATNVTVTRGATGAASVNIEVEAWHSIEDSEPLPGGIATSNFPFVVQGNPTVGGAAAVVAVSQLEFNRPTTVFDGADSVMTFNYQTVAHGLSATQVGVLVDMPAGIGAGAESVTLGIGVYTMAGSTASLASSASTLITYNTANDSNFSQPRWRTMTGNFNFTAGEYLIGHYAHGSTTFGQSIYGGVRLGPVGSNAPGGFGDGIVTSGGNFTLAPGSVHLTNIVQTGVTKMVLPTMHFVGSF